MDACWLDCGSNATCVNTNVNSTCECDAGFEGTYPACNGSTDVFVLMLLNGLKSNSIKKLSKRLEVSGLKKKIFLKPYCVYSLLFIIFFFLMLFN